MLDLDSIPVEVSQEKTNEIKNKTTIKTPTTTAKYQEQSKKKNEDNEKTH